MAAPGHQQPPSPVDPDPDEDEDVENIDSLEEIPVRLFPSLFPHRAPTIYVEYPEFTGPCSGRCREWSVDGAVKCDCFCACVDGFA